MTPDARKEVLATAGVDSAVEHEPSRTVDPVAAPAEEADEAAPSPFPLVAVTVKG